MVVVVAGGAGQQIAAPYTIIVPPKYMYSTPRDAGQEHDCIGDPYDLVVVGGAQQLLEHAPCIH